MKGVLTSDRKTVDSRKTEWIQPKGSMAIEAQENSTDYYNSYRLPQYTFSSPGSENPDHEEEIKLLNPDMDTLQQHHDFYVALWEARVIYINEIPEYQIAMRRESCAQVLPLDRSRFQKQARDKARERADQSTSAYQAAV